MLQQALYSTTKLSSFVMFILIGARVFGLTFYGINGNVWIEDLLLALPGGQTGFLIVVTIIVFVLGCFLDFFEIAFILVPLLAPVAQKLGIDLIWFGIILGINLQTSFLTPPFGFALFYLRSIAPKTEWLDTITNRMMPGVRTTEIYKGAVPYIALQAIVIGLIIAFPRTGDALQGRADHSHRACGAECRRRQDHRAAAERQPVQASATQPRAFRAGLRMVAPPAMVRQTCNCPAFSFRRSIWDPRAARRPRTGRMPRQPCPRTARAGRRLTSGSGPPAGLQLPDLQQPVSRLQRVRQRRTETRAANASR